MTGKSARQPEEAYRLNEARLEALLRLHQMTNASVQELMHFALEEATRLTESQIGYLAQVNDAQDLLTMYSWSKSAMAECAVGVKPIEYPLETTGLWGEPVRQRRSMITNDYAAPNPYKKGTPEGHIALTRHMGVPIFEGEKIVLLAGVGNKASDYDESDLRQLTLLMTGMWEIIQHRRTQTSRQQRERELEALAQISAALRKAQTRAEMLPVILDQLLKLTHGSGAALVMQDPAAPGEFTCTGSGVWSDWTGSFRPDDQLPPAGGLMGQVMAFGATLVNNNLLEDGSGLAIAGVPLSVQAQTVGELWIARSTPVGDSEVRLLTAVGDIAANAIRRATLHEDLEAQFKTLQETQARLVMSEKLSGIGEMIAGVAHELNNPLTSILIFAQLLQARSWDDETSSSLDRIVTEARRAAAIVRGLLDFARQHPPEWKPVQIDHLVQATLELLAYELRTNNITVTVQAAQDLPVILGDARQLQQVLVNLIRNARQAIRSVATSGNITICIKCCGAQFARDRQPDEPVVSLCVRDDGPGIPPGLLTRIFDPFFTTKGSEDGTGLGLSICHGIIARHKGHIWAENGPDGGAVFIIELPVGKEAAAETAMESAAEPPALGSGHLLIVDDELGVREVFRRVLERSGYQVDVAGDGMTGLARIEQRANEGGMYDLVICDIHMPGLSGQEVYARVRREHPELARRFLFTTGDVISPAIKAFFASAGAPYLSKPFDGVDLVRRVGEVLERERHPRI